VGIHENWKLVRKISCKAKGKDGAQTSSWSSLFAKKVALFSQHSRQHTKQPPLAPHDLEEACGEFGPHWLIPNSKKGQTSLRGEDLCEPKRRVTMSAGQKSRLAKNLRWRTSAWARHSGVSAITLLCVGVAAAQATGIAPTLSATSWSSTLRRADAGSRSPHSSLRLRGGGYSLGLRDSIMIAHSFKGEEFGPAQGMHGATYTVDVEFHVKELVCLFFIVLCFFDCLQTDAAHDRTLCQEPRLNWVLDIGEGMSVLKKVLAEYNLKNLDELFPSENTTTEFMCK